jgi:hypothetical protein
MTQVKNKGGPGVVVGVGADDLPEEQRGGGTNYLIHHLLWGFEPQPQTERESLLN